MIRPLTKAIGLCRENSFSPVDKIRRAIVPRVTVTVLALGHGVVPVGLQGIAIVHTSSDPPNLRASHVAVARAEVGVLN